MSRTKIRDRIDDMDPRRDCQQIMRLLVGCEFPFDYQRSMIELVFLKDLAAPRIAGLIHANGYIQKFPQKRYDDTAIFMMEFIKHGYDSVQGLAAIERLNRIHASFGIRQEDYLFVLVGLMFEPIEWNERFGWRRMTDKEREAHYWFWRGVGERMNLTIIPPSYERAKRFKEDYEARGLRRTHAGVALTRELFAILESWVPRPFRPAVRPVVACLLNPPFLDLFDLPQPNRLLRNGVCRFLQARSWISRWLPTASEPRFFVDRPVRSYPAGYDWNQVGPPEGWHRASSQDESRGNPNFESDPRFCHHAQHDTPESA